MEKDSNKGEGLPVTGYDEAIQRAEQLIEQLEKAEALSMDEYKRLASEVSALLRQCKDEISGMITSPDSL